MVGVYEAGKWGWSSSRNHVVEKKTKRLNIHVISDGITRLPILEGEISHIEIPRGNQQLGLTIVGGSDTPLRCVVVQEIFPDGLVAQDGRLQAGDQIIEVDGVDMTSATHQAVCQALRKPQAVLKLGVYRERIQAYRAPTPATNHQGEMVAVTLCKESHRQLGLKLGGRRTEPGIFVMEVLHGSVAAQDGRLNPNDRILAINGIDVRYARLDHASQLIHQSSSHVSLVVSRGAAMSFIHNADKYTDSSEYINYPSHHWREESSVADSGEFHSPSENRQGSDSGCVAMEYGRSGSCDSLSDHSLVSSMMSSPSTCLPSDNGGLNGSSRGPSPTASSPGYCTSDTDDMDLHHHHQNQLQHHPDRTLHHDNLTASETGSLTHQGSIDRSKQDHRVPELSSQASPETNFYNTAIIPNSPRDCLSPTVENDIMSGLQRIMRTETNQLQQKNVTIKKGVNESLGMRIGGGIGSNEGDTPIYVANINLQGPVGRCKSIKKGDVLLSVNGQSLLGLTHGQAVALLKATAELASVTLSLLDGPETSPGTANFVPSWLYWQKLPPSLHMSKSVILHRSQGASLGFSIVGGSDPQRGAEPIHVLFVVQSSPAALDGKLRCGDRLLSVDGHSLEFVRHASAVSLLKQAGERVHLEVVSWLGTEL